MVESLDNTVLVKFESMRKEFDKMKNQIKLLEDMHGIKNGVIDGEGLVFGSVVGFGGSGCLSREMKRNLKRK